MRRLSIVTIFAIVLTAFFLTGPQTISAKAPPISAGCYYINSNSAPAIGKDLNFSKPLAFHAGDVITISQRGSDWLVVYDKLAHVIRASGNGATVSWKVPAESSLELYIGDNTPKKALVYLKCTPATK